MTKSIKTHIILTFFFRHFLKPAKTKNSPYTRLTYFNFEPVIPLPKASANIYDKERILSAFVEKRSDAINHEFFWSKGQRRKKLVLHSHR